MNTYTSKSIDELDEITSISDDDLFLISHFDDENHLISKKSTKKTIFSNYVKKI